MSFCECQIRRLRHYSNEEKVIVHLQDYYLACVKYHYAVRGWQRWSKWRAIWSVKHWCEMWLARNRLVEWVHEIAKDPANMGNKYLEYAEGTAERWTLMPYRADFEDEVRHQIAREFANKAPHAPGVN